MVYYLSDRSISVNIYKYLSSPFPMKYVVPQGLILGTSLFSIYLYPLPSIISKYLIIYYYLHGVNIQLYMFFPLTHHQVSIINSLNCTNDIKLIIYNNLILNNSKTTLLNLSPYPTYLPTLLIHKIVISPFPTAYNLGVLFYSTIPSFLILLLSLNHCKLLSF